MPALTIMIKPASGLCNMRCGYCFYSDVAENREVASYGIMPAEVLETIVRRAFEYAGADVNAYVSFVFQGGEPTLAGIGFFEEFIKLQKKHNVNDIKFGNAIQTNGYAIDNRWAEFFAKNGFLTGLSLDGIRSLHDSVRLDSNGRRTYAKVIAAAARLREARAEFNILCVVTNELARHGMKVYDSLREYKYIQFIPCIAPFSGGGYYDESENDNSGVIEKRITSDRARAAIEKHTLTAAAYAKFLKTTFDCYYRDFMSGNYVSVRNFDNYVHMLLGRPPENCAMGGICSRYFVIEADGGVYPCDFYVLDKWRLGNITKSTFAELTENPAGEEFVAPSRHVSEKCQSCKWYRLCRGGCRRDREPFENRLPVLNKYCSAYMAFFDYSFGRLREIASKV